MNGSAFKNDSVFIIPITSTLKRFSILMVPWIISRFAKNCSFKCAVEVCSLYKRRGRRREGIEGKRFFLCIKAILYKEHEYSERVGMNEILLENFFR